jgi:small-conductance mechanosensitive channel
LWESIELSSPFINLFFGSVLWQDGWEIPRRVWRYVSHETTLGSVKISVLRFVLGTTILVLALFVSRTLTVLLDKRLSKRRHIDPGLRYTIARLARYLFIVIGVLIALKQFEIDLTSIAVVFTALSVGIGFGLQFIAADIASGFILLFERPVRVGDRITIGDDEGDVQSINMRTTLVVTNDRIAIIVPNSRLVSQRVINWSYGDPRARVAIPISVAYSSDVKLVTETLLHAAEGVENVLTDPQPKVQFLRFGDYSLDFRLLVWTRSPSRHPQIRSDINYRIEKLFRDRGIEIPFPTQQFLLKADAAGQLANELGAGGKLDEDDVLPAPEREPRPEN